MFAGSGALGLEAASNGAGEVVLLEKDRKSAAAIQAVVKKLNAQEQVRCEICDAFDWVKKCSAKFDVVFIDPPFALSLHEVAVKAVLPLLRQDGFLYLENEVEISDELLKVWGLESVRRGRAGAVHYLLCTRTIV